MTKISIASVAQPAEASRHSPSSGTGDGKISDRSARLVGHELARIYREVSAGLPAEHPALESIERAERVLAACKLGDKRASDAPVPSHADLQDIARGIGQVRALKDVYVITSDIEPLFSAGARCIEALSTVGQLEPYRGTIDFLRSNGLHIEVAERPHPSGSPELGFFIRSSRDLPTSEIQEWNASVDRVFDAFERRARYAPPDVRLEVRSTLDTLRNFHATLEKLDEVVARHGEKVFDSEAPSLHLVRAGEAFGKEPLEILLPRFIANNEGRAAVYATLIFGLREPQIRQTLQEIEGEPVRHFTTRLIERMVTDESPRVTHEMKRLAGLLKTHAEPGAEVHLPVEGPKNTPAVTLRANLAAKLSFLRETRGERFDNILDDISRKIGPKVAIERYHQLARCCRGRSEEGLAEQLITLEPKLLTLPGARFAAYIQELRTGIGVTPAVPAAALLPDSIGTILRPDGKPLPATPTETRDTQEANVVAQLNATGLEGEMTLTLLKHGFHHRGALFTGHRTISRQGVLGIAEAKIDGSRGELEDCLDALIRRGAVIQHPKAGGLALSRIADISEPALKAAVSYVESYWAARRQG